MPETEQKAWPYGDNLRELRGSLSAEKAARKVGVLRQTWAGWESGDSVPREENLKAIVEEFGCPPEFVGYQPPRGWELVPAPWIRQQHDEVMQSLRLIHDHLGIL